MQFQFQKRETEKYQTEKQQSCVVLRVQKALESAFTFFLCKTMNTVLIATRTTSDKDILLYIYEATAAVGLVSYTVWFVALLESPQLHSDWYHEARRSQPCSHWRTWKISHFLQQDR